MRSGRAWREWNATRPAYPPTNASRSVSMSVMRKPDARVTYAAFPMIGRASFACDEFTRCRGRILLFLRVCSMNCDEDDEALVVVGRDLGADAL